MNKKQKEKRKEIIIIISSFLIGVLLSYAFFKTYFYKKPIEKTYIYEKSSLAPTIEKVYDSVVMVESLSGSTSTGTGSGFIYKEDKKYGYILTNEHVVRDADTVKVILSTEEEVEVELLGKDQYLDLAVLRMDKKNVPLVASIGSSEEMKLGDVVLAIGTPVGYEYRGSVTSGIISGKNRSVTTYTNDSNKNDWVMSVLQTDAAINQGNSGGPLINIKGEVIGICCLKILENNIEGMGFAIPIESAMSHIETLEAKEEIEWPILGINMVNVTDTSNLVKYDLPILTDRKDGIVVIDIKEGTPASKANLQKGDIIVEIDKQKTNNIAYFKYELYKHKVGDTIEIKIIRDGKEKKIKVNL